VLKAKRGRAWNPPIFDQDMDDDVVAMASAADAGATSACAASACATSACATSACATSVCSTSVCATSACATVVELWCCSKNRCTRAVASSHRCIFVPSCNVASFHRCRCILCRVARTCSDHPHNPLRSLALYVPCMHAHATSTMTHGNVQSLEQSN
jgi:hypothetical protein